VILFSRSQNKYQCCDWSSIRDRNQDRLSYAVNSFSAAWAAFLAAEQQKGSSYNYMVSLQSLEPPYQPIMVSASPKM
jgi:hypothetical protein